MNMTASQHQKQVDDAGYLTIEAERIEQECRETLLKLHRWPIQHYWSAPAMTTEQDVTEALYDLCHDELVLALSLLDTDPLEAVRILKECRARAVEDVLGRMDFEAITKSIIEESKRNAA